MALILDGTSPTGAWSMFRDLLTSFVGGTRYTTATGVNQLTDQSGNARHFSQSGGVSQPVVTTAGPLSRTCADFDGVNHLLQTTGFTLADFISASSGYVIVSFIADAITTSAPNIYNNSSVFADGSGYVGVFMKTPNVIASYNWDGSEKSTTATITTATPYIVEWRHDTGNLYIRINGGTETSIASGNTSVLTGVLLLAGGNSRGNIKVFELATWSTVPSLATRDAIVADFKAQIVPTTAQITQVALEQWNAPIPQGQVTQAAVEMWATTSTINGQAYVTQAAIEMWAAVANRPQRRVQNILRR